MFESDCNGLYSKGPLMMVLISRSSSEEVRKISVLMADISTFEEELQLT